MKINDVDKHGNVTEYEIAPFDADMHFLHMEMSGGDGMVPPGAGIGGNETIIINSSFREDRDPISPLVNITSKFRIPIRNSEGAISNVIKVSFTNGVMKTVNYKSKGSDEGIFHIDQKDFTDEIAGKLVELIGITTYKIYDDKS